MKRGLQVGFLAFSPFLQRHTVLLLTFNSAAVSDGDESVKFVLPNEKCINSAVILQCLPDPVICLTVPFGLYLKYQKFCNRYISLMVSNHPTAALSSIETSITHRYLPSKLMVKPTYFHNSEKIHGSCRPQNLLPLISVINDSVSDTSYNGFRF